MSVDLEIDHSTNFDDNMRRSQRLKRKEFIQPEIKDEKEDSDDDDEEVVKKEEESDDEWEESDEIAKKKPKMNINAKENMKTLGLSEYEKMVLKNREEKEAFLRSLKIDEVKEEIKSLVPVKRPCFKRPKIAPTLPTRKSRRLAKIQVNLSEEALYENAIAEATQEKETKVLPTLLYPFDEAISVKEEYSNFLNDYSMDSKKNIKHKSCEPDFRKLKLLDCDIAKVVPVRITGLTVHPSTDRIITIAGSKYGHIGFWNVTSNSNPVVFSPHIEGVTCLKTNPYSHHQIFSSSYDGTVRCGDMEKKVFQLVFDVSEETCCTYFDFISPTTFLVSQRNGFVSIVDSRSRSENNQKKHECHVTAVKTVSIHPVNKSLFLTASTKGEMKLWDLRKLQQKAVIHVSHHNRSVSSAFFSPITGNSILSTSLDNSLGIFDSSNLEKEILFKRSVRHDNHTGRWLSPFKASWIPFSENYFVVGSMEQPRRIHVYDSSGGKNCDLNDENLNSITSLNEFHPTLNVLAGGNSSGKVYIFKDKQLKF